jgi:flagellar motor switch protein FliM
VMAMLGQTNVPLQTVLALKVGDMVWLDCAQTDYLPVFVEQSLKFLAQPIARNGALGVEIVARVP